MAFKSWLRIKEEQRTREEKQKQKNNKNEENSVIICCFFLYNYLYLKFKISKKVFYK
jgi:hypothetical protein